MPGQQTCICGLGSQGGWGALRDLCVPSRRPCAPARRAAARAEALRPAPPQGEEDEEGLPGGLSAADLAGAKVRHTAEELEEGETMILTLEDKSILDEKGNLREDDDLVLENILAVGLAGGDGAARGGWLAARMWSGGGFLRGWRAGAVAARG